MPKIALALLTAALLAGCGPDDTATTSGGDEKSDVPAGAEFDWPEGWPPVSERLVQPSLRPAPYTIDQIRKGCGPKSRRVFRREQAEQETVYELWTFSNITAVDCTHHITPCNAEGEAIGDPRSYQAKWASLQMHGTIPIADTTAKHAKLKTPAGEFKCLHYTRPVEGRAGKGEDQLWFSWDHPGPPIRIERRVMGALLLTMTLVKVEGVGP